MNVLDFVEIWWLSVRAILESAGVVGRFERSRDDRLNPSCSLNLRRDGLEADLLLWESGEAELSVVEVDGSTNHKHFDNIQNPRDLGWVLSRLADLASGTRAE